MAYSHTQQEYRCVIHVDVRNGKVTAGACRVCKPEGDAATDIVFYVPWTEAHCKGIFS